MKTEKNGPSKCKKQSIYAKICKRLRIFFLKIYLYSHIFYILLHQENQDLANAMHQGCPTRSLREPRGTAMIKQLLRTGFLLKNISKTLEN